MDLHDRGNAALAARILAILAHTSDAFFYLFLFLIVMGELVISRAACRAISAHRRTTAHITFVSSVLCTGYVVNKTVSCVLMNMILVRIK
jgi:hypothetical protein